MKLSLAQSAALAALHASRRGVRIHPLPRRVSAALVLMRELLDAHTRPGIAAAQQPLRASLRSIAASLSVSDRTLRRWLSGEDRPAPEHHAALLAAAAALRRAAAKISASTEGAP